MLLCMMGFLLDWPLGLPLKMLFFYVLFLKFSSISPMIDWENNKIIIKNKAASQKEVAI